MCFYHISGRCSLFIPECTSTDEKIGPKILKKILCNWRMTNKFIWFYQPNLAEDFRFQGRKSWINILHCTIFLLLLKFHYSFFTFASKKMHDFAHWKSMNKFRFLRSLFKVAVPKNFRIFTEKHLCWSLFLRIHFFHRTPPMAASVIFQ